MQKGCVKGSLREGAPQSGGGECVHSEKYYFTPTLAPSVTASLLSSPCHHPLGGRLLLPYRYTHKLLESLYQSVDV